MGSRGQEETTGKGQKRCQQEMDRRKVQSPCPLVPACCVNPRWPGLAYQGKMPGLEVQRASWRSVMFQAGPKPEPALAMLGRRVAGNLPNSKKPRGFSR